jgi:DNA-directed RNA polymerase subunit RPC12/RpoP
MSDTSTVALSCPKCGARLEITARISVFACSYCLSNVMVERAGGIVSLSLVDAVSLVQRGTDKTAAELAINRLKVDLDKAQEELLDYSNRTQRLVNAVDRQQVSQSQSYKTGLLLLPLVSAGLGYTWINTLFHREAVGIISGLFCAVAAYVLIKAYMTRIDRFLKKRHTQIWNDRLPGLKKVEGTIDMIELQLAKNLNIANA